MERGQLVAERLACARRHHRDRIVTLHDRLDDGLLSGSEFFQAERASHEPFDWSNWACHVAIGAISVPTSRHPWSRQTALDTKILILRTASPAQVPLRELNAES